MRNWKSLLFLVLIAALAGACSSSSEETVADEAAKAGAEAAVAEKKPEPPKPVVIPAGTTLQVTLSTALDSGKNKPGDRFTGNLSEDVVVDGKTALAKGTAIEGTVVSAEGAGRVSGKGQMSLTLTSATVGGKTIALNTKTHSAEAKGQTGKDAALIGGGAGVGAAIGAIAGGGKGAAIGAAVGGAGGTGAVLATKGKDVEYPAEAKLGFTLEQDVKL